MSTVERLAGGPPLWRTRRGRAVLGLVRRRRLVAAVLAVLGVLGLVGAVRPPPRRTVPVLAAAHDLAGGVPLRAGDLATVRLPPAAVPAGAVRAGAAVGRMPAGPVRRGEPLTDARLLGPGLLAGYGPDVVAAPVRVADADAVALLRPGDRVDVLAGGSVLAAAVPVAAVPRGGGASAIERDGALIVVAVHPEDAGKLADGQMRSRISVTIRSR